MTKVFTLLGFIAELPAIARDVEATGPMIVERACQMIQKRAKAAIGREHDFWAPLADSTIADKQHQGYPTPKPLLRTGELRDSIQYIAHGNEGHVGSDLDVAVWQELGTSRIPARSFLVSSAIASEDKIHRLATAATIAALSGYGRHASELREIIHALHRVGHEFKKTIEDLFDDEDNEHKGSK